VTYFCEENEFGERLNKSTSDLPVHFVKYDRFFLLFALKLEEIEMEN
jgi:hypothetical protein